MPVPFRFLTLVISVEYTTAISKDGQVVGELSAESRSEWLSKRNMCCTLGKEVAKIGDSCTYVQSLAAIKPDLRRFHKLKTRLWQNKGGNPINVHKLQKCRRFKAYYEKCCLTEAARMVKDIRRLSKTLQRYLHKKDRSNSVKESAKG